MREESQKRSLKFSVERFKELQDFIKEYGNASTDDYNFSCKNRKTHIHEWNEDEARHLFIISKNGTESAKDNIHFACTLEDLKVPLDYMNEINK